jgi:FlaA1/EpsC-like NDP-sugar epimerase
MPQFMKNSKRLLFVAGDLAAVLVANLMATSLRFDFDWSLIAVRRQRNIELLVLDLLITPVVFYLAGLYQGYWRYTSLVDLLRLARAIMIRTAALIVLFYALGFVGLSRAVLIMSTVLLMIMTGLSRLAPRFHFEFFSTRKRMAGARALIIGAGDTGESLLRELRKGTGEYNPVGFIDDDTEKAGVKIHGVPVLGDRNALERIVEEYGIREVIVAIPGATGQQIRQVFEVCRRTGARLRTVPTHGELARGAARISQIRLVDLEDLLGREAVNLDQQVLRQNLTANRILVTGAAGSIGRELARQIAAYEPEMLILLDRNENNLFYLEAELRESHPLLGLEVIVGDVLDRKRLERLFRELRPRAIFHASAYKHVPFMEHNPVEAIKNNVLATYYLAEIAAAHAVDRFIYVSTDKAVQPTSVMGATKRLGERLIKSIPSEITRFMAVRFGNVLGSDGSVVPTFRRQIAAGGPVTVTHPEVTRYFMTIPEAVQLVLMAGAMGDGGETFLLQMGQPVRIIDLARNLIELSGLKPGEDIEVVFTGLRPGEKLHEVLKDASEEALPTPNEKIMALTGVEPIGEAGWLQMRALEETVMEGLVEPSLAALRLLVPDYRPLLLEQKPLATSAPKIVEIGAKRRLDMRT